MNKILYTTNWYKFESLWMAKWSRLENLVGIKMMKINLSYHGK